MVRIQESTITQAMQFVMDTWFPGQEKLMDFDNSKEWRIKNPTTGKIRLVRFPDCKEAWVLVKFSELKRPNYGKSIVPQQYKTIRTEEEFRNFFGVEPVKGYEPDMTIVCSWDRQEKQNKNTADRFDETTPDFYMYINHTGVNPEKIVNRLKRINDAMIKLKGDDSGLYNLPYSFTDL